MKLKFYSILVIVIFKNIINVILMEFLIFMWVKYFRKDDMYIKWERYGGRYIKWKLLIYIMYCM